MESEPRQFTQLYYFTMATIDDFNFLMEDWLLGPVNPIIAVIADCR